MPPDPSRIKSKITRKLSTVLWDIRLVKCKLKPTLREMRNGCGKTLELRTPTGLPTGTYENCRVTGANLQVYTLVHTKPAVLQGQTYRPTHSYIRELQCYKGKPIGLHTRIYENCSVTRANLQSYTLVHTWTVVLQGQTYRPTHWYIRELQCYMGKPTGLHTRTYNCRVKRTNLSACTLLTTRTHRCYMDTTLRPHTHTSKNTNVQRLPEFYLMLKSICVTDRQTNTASM
jgi:hypothetical protein